MSMRPAIVVMAHARPEETERLLGSVCRAEVGDGVDLVVSIDRGSDEMAGARLAQLIDALDWPHGSLRKIEHDGLGLVGHFHRCGDLSIDYGAIVLLEDDLLVGPGFHRWVEAIVPVIEADDRVAGASLAMPWFDGFRHHRFEPIHDGNDVVYAQVPWYDGMVFTSGGWQAYRDTDAPQRADRDRVTLHESFGELGADEWFPDLVRHLVATDRYWALPRLAQATGTGAIGTHFDQRTDWFQSELCAGFPDRPRLPALDASGSVYDDHMEPTAASVRRLAPMLPTSFVVDLLGVRDLSALDDDELVLTIRPVHHAVASWGAAMHPLVMNVVHDEPGDRVHLARAVDVEDGPKATAQARATLQHHHRRGRQPQRRELIADLSAELSTDLSAGASKAAQTLGMLGRKRGDRSDH